ncbi:MAG TPA: hypothetical protein PKA27_04605 [Fimbriimonadaceae bacterium]|nr:hypothetical protein [Fimbriimonadaceae bacterium]
MPAVATLLGLLVALQSSEPLDISHKFVANDKSSFTIDGKADANGQEITVNGEFQVEIKKLLDGGRADAHITTPKMKVAVGDQELPLNDGELDAVFTSSGLPESFGVKDVEMVSAMYFFSNLRPTEKIKVGDSYKIDLKTKDSAVTLKGTGKFVEIKEVNGKKVVVMKSNLTVEPENEAPGELIVTSEYEQGGQLIKSTIELTIEEVKGTFKINRKST